MQLLKGIIKGKDMLKVASFKEKMEWYAKFLVAFLLIFIPCRNALELCLGTYVKVIPDVLILVLMLIFFVYKKGRVEFKIYDFIILLFLGLGFVNSVILNGISLYTYVFAVRSTMVYYILFFVIRNFEFDNKYIVLLTKILRYITYVLFVFGVIEKIGNKTVLFPQSVADNIIYADNFARVYSMFFNPNTYGAFLVLAFFVVIHYEKNSKDMVLYKIVTVASLLLSMSRSAILIFVIGLMAYGIVFKREMLLKKKFILHLLLILLSGILVYATCEKVTELLWYSEEEGTTTVYDRLEELHGEEIVAESNAVGRLFYVKTGLKIFKAHPLLGTGFGTYGSAASMSWEPPIYDKYGLEYGFYSDNEYIKDLVETGLVGILLLMAFCGSIIYAYRHNFFCVCLCVIFCWFGLFYNVLEVQIVSFLLWGVLGILSKEQKMQFADNGKDK